MEYLFNNVKVESVRDGWFKSSVFNVFIGGNSFKHAELNRLNQDNIIRPDKKGRGSCVLVNGECIKEWISKSYRLSLFNKVNIGKFIGIVYKCIMNNNFELYKTY